MNYKTYKPTRAISLKGKILTRLIRFGFLIRSVFTKKVRYPLKGHHEDPLRMTNKERLYLGYKYYYKAMIHAGKEVDIGHHFQQPLRPQLPEEFEPKQQISLSVGGDLMPYDCISKETCAHLWDEAGDFFFSSDIVFANLETPIDITQKPSAVPEVMLNNMYFNGSEELFDVFSAFGQYGSYDVLSIANNHSLDQGSTGFLNTMKFLSEKQISYCGGAPNENALHDFPIIERNGISIAFLAYTFSLNMEIVPAETPWLCNHIRLNEPNPAISLIVQQATIARERGADLVAISLHMGCAYQPYPDQTIIDNVERICRETKADLILGGHPHNPQPLSFYRYTDPITETQHQSLIIYSLGDFVAYDIFKWCHIPLIAKIHISKGMLGQEQRTFISGIELKSLYIDAAIHRGKVTALKFRDLQQGENSTLKDSLSSESEAEWKEVAHFLNTYVYPVNKNEILKS